MDPLPNHPAALPDSAEESHAPARLAAELRAIALADRAPASLDARVLALAQQHAPASRRLTLAGRAPWRAAIGAVAALAAVLSLAALLWPAPSRQRASVASAPARPHTSATPAPEGDLNHDGHLDILDAFALARDLRDRAQPLAAGDVNHDGAIDGQDVDALAALAVRIATPGAPAPSSAGRSIQ